MAKSIQGRDDIIKQFSMQPPYTNLFHELQHGINLQTNTAACAWLVLFPVI